MVGGWGGSEEEFGLFAFIPLLTLIPYINKTQCKSRTMFYRHGKRKQKRHNFSLEMFVLYLSDSIPLSFMPHYLFHLLLVLPL